MEADKELVKRIHALETSIKEFKSPQPVGTDSVRTYTNLTNNQWDETWTSSPDPGGYNLRTFRVRFLADHQDAPFGRIRVLADFNGVKYDPATPGDAYLSSTRHFLSAEDEFLGNGFNLDNPMLDEFENPRLLRFYVRVSTAGTGVTVRLKFIVDATDTGRIYTV